MHALIKQSENNPTLVEYCQRNITTVCVCIYTEMMVIGNWIVALGTGRLDDEEKMRGDNEAMRWWQWQVRLTKP